MTQQLAPLPADRPRDMRPARSHDQVGAGSIVPRGIERPDRGNLLVDVRAAVRQRAIEGNVRRQDLIRESVVPRSDQGLCRRQEFDGLRPQADRAGRRPMATQRTGQRVFGEENRIPAMAVGQHHDAVARIQVPYQVQDETR